MIKLVTDTTCDLPEDWLTRYNITRVPLNIQFGLDTYEDQVTLTRDDFYARIEAENALPTTSQPSVGVFNKFYNELGADGSEILSIHLTSKLSGTWQSATLSERELRDQLSITVFDSLISSAGLGLMMVEAAQCVEAGWSVADIVSLLEKRRPQIKVYIMLKDLRYARMSGRVGRLREFMASMLNIKPIIGVNEGELFPVDRIRSHSKGIERMLELAEADSGDNPIHLGVVHAQAPAEGEALLKQLEARFNCQETFVTDLALSLAVHFGPGTVGFATYPAEPIGKG